MELNQSMIEKIKSNSLSEFDMALAKLKMEFEQNIYNIDTLDKEQVGKALALFNKRLVIFQYDFLKYLRNTFSETNDFSPKAFDFKTPSTGSMSDIYSGILAGGSSMLALSLITVTQTTGWWIFATTTSTSLGAIIGSAVGVSAAVATAGIGLVSAVGVGFAVNRLTRKPRRKAIRNKIIEKYSKDVEPKLREWAQETIDKVSNHPELLKSSNL